MGYRYPLEYDLSPRSVAQGTRWLNLTLSNKSDQDLTGMDIRLNSMDAYSLSVLGTGSYIVRLKPGEEETIAFQIWANGTSRAYLTVDAWRNGDPLHWESPAIWLEVAGESAELARFMALTQPYPVLGERISCEAVIRGLTNSEGLQLEIWEDTPSGKFRELASIQTKALSAGEEARYSAEIEPDEEGGYTVYAYLYDGNRRIGRETEYVYVSDV